MLVTKSWVACQISGQTLRPGGNTGQGIQNCPRMTMLVGNYYTAMVKLICFVLTSMDSKRLPKIENGMLPMSGRIIWTCTHVNRVLHPIKSNIKVANQTLLIETPMAWYKLVRIQKWGHCEPTWQSVSCCMVRAKEDSNSESLELTLLRWNFYTRNWQL